MSLPLLIGGVCIVTSILGTYFVRLGKGTSIMGAMYKGFGVTAVTSAIAIYFATQYALGDLNAAITAGDDQLHRHGPLSGACCSAWSSPA